MILPSAKVVDLSVKSSAAWGRRGGKSECDRACGDRADTNNHNLDLPFFVAPVAFVALIALYSQQALENNPVELR
jgi:hypothetical protein